MSLPKAGYDGYYNGAHERERYRQRLTRERRVAVQRELEQPTHIPGDLSTATIERIIARHLLEIRRRRHGHAA